MYDGKTVQEWLRDSHQIEVTKKGNTLTTRAGGHHWLILAAGRRGWELYRDGELHDGMPADSMNLEVADRFGPQIR
jgi:hypothetical protein